MGNRARLDRFGSIARRRGDRDVALETAQNLCDATIAVSGSGFRFRAAHCAYSANSGDASQLPSRSEATVCRRASNPRADSVRLRALLPCREAIARGLGYSHLERRTAVQIRHELPRPIRLSVGPASFECRRPVRFRDGPPLRSSQSVTDRAPNAEPACENCPWQTNELNGDRTRAGAGIEQGFSPCAARKRPGRSRYHACHASGGAETLKGPSWRMLGSL